MDSKPAPRLTHKEAVRLSRMGPGGADNWLHLAEPEKSRRYRTVGWLMLAIAAIGAGYVIRWVPF